MITVREARAHSSAGAPTLSAGWRRPFARWRPGGPERPDGNARGRLRADPAGQVALRSGDRRASRTCWSRRRRPRRCAGRRARWPRSARVDDLVQWYMALDGNRTGPFTRSKLVERLAPLAKSADVHIWNEKLDGWKPPAAVPEIAAETPAVARPRRRRRRCRPAGLRRRRCRRGGDRRIGGAAARPAGAQADRAARAAVAYCDASIPPGSKLPPPGGVHPALAARGADHGAADASSLLETPAPQPHICRTRQKRTAPTAMRRPRP